jgi:hypothetical protein
MILEEIKEYFDDASDLVLSEHSLEGVFKPIENLSYMLEALPPETINNIQEITKSMVGAGFEKECSNVYSSCRRQCLEECLIKQLLGSEKLSIEDVNNIPSKDLKLHINRWIKASKVALKILFPTERRLCDVVFFGLSAVADLCFSEVCRGWTIYLLNFGEAVANIGSRSPEQLFQILDMFETLCDLIPEFDSLFCDQYSVSLRNDANTVSNKLGEAIVAIFMEFANKIHHDPVKAAVPGGRIHPLVRYVMNYLILTCDYQQTLEQVFEDYGHLLKEYLKLDDTVPSSSSFSVIDHIMEVLENNLEAKSKVYNDPILCCVFLMNSSSYILNKAKDNEFGEFLGNDMIQKHKAKVMYYYEQYQRISWNKVLGFLKLDKSGLVPPSMVEKLKSFNILFEEICKVQSLWFVFDEQLRDVIRISLKRDLLPVYRNFIGRFHSVMKLRIHADKYIKYGMKDIEARLDDLFQGSSGSTSGQKRG